jgi:hypothetical protein
MTLQLKGSGKYLWLFLYMFFNWSANFMKQLCIRTDWNWQCQWKINQK